MSQQKIKKIVFTLASLLAIITLSGAEFIGNKPQISKARITTPATVFENTGAAFPLSKSLFSPHLTPTLPENPQLKCPLPACIVLKEFQMGKHKWNPGHRGVDLNTAKSTTVSAPADGEIIYAGMLVDRSIISIKHKNDFRSTFEPVIPFVKVGDTVKSGDKIGLVTAKHCPTMQCLHWGFKLGSDGYLNPMDFLHRKRIRLLS